MSLISTPASERVHIGFFGLRNAGKSSLVNAVTAQNLSLVSDVKGTTTDPVKKAMELLPLGPVVIIDTPGIDDVGELGEMRVKRAKDMLSVCDIAVFVTDGTKELCKAEKDFIAVFKSKKIPYIIAKNKADLLSNLPENASENEIFVSAQTNYNIELLKEKIARIGKSTEKEKRILADIVSKGDTIILITPIDESAPKGRLILPQQQIIRELLDIGATTLIVKETELQNALDCLGKKPDLVITDSQVFGYVSKILPTDILLTSFSILFARYKGDLSSVVEGAATLSKLKDGDKVLISEGCTHHRQCNDIGTVKMPGWIKNYTNKNIIFEFTSGTQFSENLKEFALVVHCGACMLGEKEVKSRFQMCKENAVPITNYGIAIAQMHGILKRSLEPFPQIFQKLK